MNHEQSEEWQRLIAAAVADLTAPVVRTDSAVPAKPLALAAVVPAFADGESFVIVDPKREPGGALLALRRTWRWSRDERIVRDPIERMRHPTVLTPTIETREAPLARDLAAAFMERATTLRIPAYIPRHATGLDGDTFVLTFGDSFASASYRWWARVPAGWEPLAGLHDELVGLVKGVLDNQ